MSDLDYEISQVIVAKLREQAEAHLAIAESLTRRGSFKALCRADVHAELGRRYALLAEAEQSGRLNYTATEPIVLTRRERQILACLDAGGSTEDVAATLGLSLDRTFKHIGALLRRLGARDRVQAITIAYRYGLLSAPLKVAPCASSRAIDQTTVTTAGATS